MTAWTLAYEGSGPADVTSGRTVVIGIGDERRGRRRGAGGRTAARRGRARACHDRRRPRDPAEFVELWTGADLAVVIAAGGPLSPA
nr:hypothetical protein GCM10020093_010440 [Planobispora longispora]